MTTPLPDLDGYQFFAEDFGSPLFEDPVLRGMDNPADPYNGRVMTVHDTCGAVVPWGRVEAHNAWHAALGG